jgi:hypothetical protein
VVGGFNDMLTHQGSCQITGNDLTDNGNGYTPNAIGVGLVVGDGPQNCTISGNTMRHNHVIGLQLLGFPQDQNITITGNVLSSNGILGTAISTIGLYGGFQNVLASGNFITDEATSTIATAQRTSNVVTVTTTTAHNYQAGYSIDVSGTPGGAFDGTFTIASIVNARIFTFAQTGADTALQGGKVYSNSLGFNQKIGLNILNSNNSQFIDNVIENNHLRNIEIYSDAAQPSRHILFQGWNFPSVLNDDLYVNAAAVLGPNGITLSIPDLQSTTTACTTAASAGATCTTMVTTNFGVANPKTFCSLQDTPNAQMGNPIILKVVDTNVNQATVTIGSFDGQAAGGGTLVCASNYRY